MLKNFGIIISTVLCTSQLLSIIQQCAASDGLVCKDDKTVEVPLLKDGDLFQCLAVPSANVGEGYIHTPGLGYHKFHTEVKTWNDARKVCIDEGAHLAILDSQKEVTVLGTMFNQSFKEIYDPSDEHPNTDFAWLGAHDLFEEADWVTVLGDFLNSTSRQKPDFQDVGWNIISCGAFGPQPDNKNINGTIEHCAALIRKCVAMNDVICNLKIAFFCEKPDTCS